MGYIYKITNTVNGKIYIGKTERDIKTRWAEHVRHKLDYSILSQAIQKYGADKFSIECIEIVKDNINIREQYWINYFNSTNHDKGYNITLGGEGYLRYNGEDFLELWNKGYNCQEIAHKLNANNATVGAYLTQLGIDILQKEERKGQYARKREFDPVLQFDKQNNLIKEWDNASQIERETGWLRSNIKSCCNGKLKSAYGFIWKRKNQTGPQRV